MNSITMDRINKLSQFERCNLFLVDVKKLHLMLSVLVDREKNVPPSIFKLMQDLIEIMPCVRLSAEEGKNDYLEEQTAKILDTLDAGKRTFFNYVQIYQSVLNSVDNPENKSNLNLPNSNCLIDKSKLKSKYESMEIKHLYDKSVEMSRRVMQDCKTYSACYLLHTTLRSKKMKKKNEQTIQELMQTIDEYIDYMLNTFLTDMQK